jgi:WhiB family redox-sensing transcriptional regulator
MTGPAKLPTVGATFAGAAEAACRRYPTDLFFPERGEQADQARAVCAWCLCRAACLDFALAEETRQHFGVWGGTTERDRRDLVTGRMSREQATKRLRRVAGRWKPPTS